MVDFSCVRCFSIKLNRIMLNGIISKSCPWLDFMLKAEKCSNVPYLKTPINWKIIFEHLFEFFLNEYLDDKTFKWTQFLSCLIAEGTPCVFL